MGWIPWRVWFLVLGVIAGALVQLGSRSGEGHTFGSPLPSQLVVWLVWSVRRAGGSGQVCQVATGSTGRVIHARQSIAIPAVEPLCVAVRLTGESSTILCG